jgi:uncharacterized BrkB/YihY/UPF0761 family membrane protein
MFPSAALALVAVAAGTFLFLPSRWSWRQVRIGVLLAAGVALVGSIGFVFV